jgi:hypothetical protein
MAQSIRTQTSFPLQNQPVQNSRVICDIPLTADLENLLLTLYGSVTLSTGATALLADGILNLIQSVDLVGDGKDVIMSVPFHQLVKGNLWRRKKGHRPTVIEPGVTIAAHAFEAIGFVDLSAFGMIRPKDSALRENKYRTLQLVARFGSFTNVFTGGGVVVSASTINLTIRAKETVELVDATGRASAPIVRVQDSYREETVTGAVTKHRFRLTPDQALRGLVLHVQDGASALSDAVLDRVRVYVGKTLRYELTAADIKDLQKAEHINGSTNETGYYFVDLADGNGSADKLNDCYDLRTEKTAGADSYIEFDTSAAAKVGVRQYGYVPQ